MRLTPAYQRNFCQHSIKGRIVNYDFFTQQGSQMSNMSSRRNHYHHHHHHNHHYHDRLQIGLVQTKDFGSYVCIASNQWGETKHQVIIVILVIVILMTTMMIVVYSVVPSIVIFIVVLGLSSRSINYEAENSK